MYPASFDYVRAESLDHALSLLQESSDAKLIAGGHSLIPMMKLRLAMPETVIDIGRISELSGITEADGKIRIGALTTHAEIAASEILQQHCPLVAQAAHEIGDAQVRNRGTIGGNVAHADPGSDLPGALLAVGANMHLRGSSGSRTVAAEDFFVDLLTTDLGEDEIVTAVEVPTLAQGTGCSYLKFEHPASGYAVAAAAAWLTLGSDGLCTGGGLALNGVANIPLDGSAVAEALIGSSASDEEIANAVASINTEEPMEDVYASGEYRLHLGRVHARRALIEARNRARG